MTQALLIYEHSMPQYFSPDRSPHLKKDISVLEKVAYVYPLIIYNCQRYI